jgi:subtilase family serine protease
MFQDTRRNIPAVVLVCLAALLIASPAFSQSAGKRTSPNTQLLGAEDTSKLITVTVWLNQHNKAELDKSVSEMYRPGSPTFHHFLTREEYRSKFAPTAAEAAQVRAYLAAHHFVVTSVEKYNHYVVAQGRVGDAQNAFGVQLSRVSTRGEVHRVSSGAAKVPGTVGALIQSVHGLADFAPRPTLARQFNPETGKAVSAGPLGATDLKASVAAATTCLNGVQTVHFTTDGGVPKATYSGNRYGDDTNFTCPGYTPKEVQTAYGLNGVYSKGWDGTGQTIVIVDAYGSDTIRKDANIFSSIYGLPELTGSNFKIYYPGGKVSCAASKNCGTWNTETSLDVEWAHAVAPGANIALVVAPDPSSLDIAEFWAIENPEVITNYANGDLGYQISNSWAGFEILDVIFNGQSVLKTEYAMTELAASLGISTNFASGDWGDNVQLILDDFGITVPPSVVMPASAPYATGIGGTSLFLNSNNSIQFQTGWGNNETRLSYPDPNPPYDPPLHLGFVFGAGGGTSAIWPKPAYQKSLGGSNRKVPDISYIADPYTGVNVIISIKGTTYLEVIGGTSLATPVFSGVWAITNQAAGSKAPLGQAAPLLYSLPSGAITDILAVDNGNDVQGKIFNPPAPVLVETARKLAAPLQNTTEFLSALYHGSSTRWYDLTFGTDSSLVTRPGWDNVTGLGTPNGLSFVNAVVAAAP